jgi:hypothetical protein
MLCCNCQLGNWTQPNSSCVRSSLNNLGKDPLKIPLPLLLRVDSLLQECVYRTVEYQRHRREPTENAACNTFSIVAWRLCVRDAFLCCVWTGHYLATAVFFLPPQFLLLANIRNFMSSELLDSTKICWDPALWWDCTPFTQLWGISNTFKWTWDISR